MTKKSLEIHSENILPIIKRWLYSDKDIFVREVISNSCDAIHKLKLLSDHGEAEFDSSKARIDIKIDKENKTLSIIDTGLGMNAEEVEKYISQLAFSGAEDFMKKYQSESESDQIIGHFGLGFYSVFMVASRVEVNTLSYKADAKPVLWSCDGSSEYEVTAGSRDTIGTEIILHISDDESEYLEEARIKDILSKYCSFLKYPIHLNETHINHQEPLWMKNPSECEEKDYIEFYQHLYPMEPEPLFWIHLNIDYPFNLRGILYFSKVRNDINVNKKSIQLYCNRVFVSDDCKDLLPDYLMMLKGAIDSPDIPLNVSRSTLQMDSTVRRLGKHISKKVSDRLSNLFKNDREKFVSCWSDIELVVKVGAIQDQKFYSRVKDFILWKDASSGAWVTVEEYLEKNKDKCSDKVFYTHSEKHNTQILKAYQEKGIDVICAPSVVDTHMINFLEQHMAPAKFQRIDANIEEAMIDSERENSNLDADGKTEAEHLQDYIKNKLSNETVEVSAKSLASDSLPAIITMNEEQRRMRDYFRAVNPSGDDMGLPMQRSFIVNTNSKMIKSLEKLDAVDATLSQELINHIYDATLLSQHELNPDELASFIENSNSMLEKLLEKVVENDKA